MAQLQQAATHNRLLAVMPAQDFERLQPHLTPVGLPREMSLVQPNQPVTHVYFMETGIGSTVTTTPEGQIAETGFFGHDGLSAPFLALGVDQCPQHSFMQVGGNGHVLGAEQLRRATAESQTLRDLLLVYAHVLTMQTAYTALSNAVHDIVERLARWILMCHDRVDGNDIALTHEFLSVMLAVRRPGVTTALHAIEGMRFIRARRGMVSVLDRPGLEDFARDAYGAPEMEYARLIGPLRKGAVAV